MKELLKDIKNLGAKLTGSYATGNNNWSSDLDFWLPEDVEMSSVKKLLAKHNVMWGSDCMGYIHTHGEDDTLEIPIEFSYYFGGEDDRLEKVTVYGVEFETY